MRTHFLYYFLIASLFYIGCKNSEKDCSFKILHFGKQEYKAEGCLNNEVETGEWSYYNEMNQLIKKGVYENGIRVGKWSYPQNKSDSVIEWKKFEKQNLALVFNVPILFKPVEDSIEYIKFSNRDSVNLFGVILSIHSLEETKKEIDQYYKQGEEEIKANGWRFTSKRERMSTKQKTFYFNDYKITPSPGDTFQVLNMYAVMKDKKLFELSCRFNREIETSARIIYFSIMTNCFYKGERFLNPMDEIISSSLY